MDRYNHSILKMPINISSSSSSSSDEEWEDFLLDTRKVILQYAKEKEDMEKKRMEKPKRLFIERNFKHAADTVNSHYFCDNPKYTPQQFRQRFRMSKSLFLRIEEALLGYNKFFEKRASASHREPISPRLKVIAGLRMLCYGTAADAQDEYLQLGKSTTLECLDYFCEGVYEIFGTQYLREPNAQDIKTLLEVADYRNFPGMLGSLDCMHWRWKNCPKALHGAYTGHEKGATVILEAVASYDTWIWHAHFGVPGSNNDLNVLGKSPIFDRLALGNSPKVAYTINGNPYNWGYYLGDGIYPNYATIVKGFTTPVTPAQIQFTKLQSANRKDVERAFGVLQARFAVVRQPARMWGRDTLAKVMKTCIILHNMIVEEERHSYKFHKGIVMVDQSNDVDPKNDDPIEDWSDKRSWNHDAFWTNMNQIQDGVLHHKLRDDLVAHVWTKFGERGF